MISKNLAYFFQNFVRSLHQGFTFLRFSSLSLICAILDYLLFLLCFWWLEEILPSIFIARVISCSINFLGSKHFTFKCKRQFLPQILRYLSLALALVFAGYGIVESLQANWQVPVYISKLIAEFILFPASFFIQRYFVFHQKNLLK